MINQLATINLSDIIQDDVGTHWQCVQEIRHYQTPDTYRFVLREVTNREPVRLAMVNKDGSQFVCADSPAKLIIGVVNVK
jgi:hypothetical protein